MSIMNTNNEVDSDTEEIYVFAEFKDKVDVDKHNSVHVLGIDTKNPILQLDETFFLGKFENPLGTFMFFEEDSFPRTEDPLFDKLPEKKLKYIHKTRKYLSLEHGFITPRDGTEGHSKANEKKQPKDDNIEPVKFESIQEALGKFKKEWSSNTEDK